MDNVLTHPENNSRLEQMVSRLKEQNFRITPQRLEVLKILASSSDHPTVEQIYAKVQRIFPTTSIATVYKTVALLREIGEILELGFPDGSNRYDGSKPFPHPHVICTKCRKILDPDLTSLRDVNQEVSQRTGFRITTHRLDFFGVCGECQE
ncbi:Fur family transcriptional regulator, peroxide stress response regulator [Desulfonatronum thiosulfatophilum]|uniref:Fur family transcriptional regulator, peroxide stress response regulator n=1 Tax=Desulfonatronum thiosulfatophilum TaxID=617002 RepID=A0A1G6ANY1_9BACT|nr:transcriptional repressor [Desulfonatronum thiosulfatophilum]SDB10108.1 Fur family transcriptional regulator, peroxide stress response regulator [Desulfonatronum thiosulfatophilum]